MVYPFSPFSTVGCVLQGGQQLQRGGVQPLSALPTVGLLQGGHPPEGEGCQRQVLCPL